MGDDDLSMRCRVPILLCALLLVLAPFGAIPVAGQPQTGGTHFDVQLHADGDATWTVSLWVPIENDDDREEFEAFAERFEAGEGDLGTDAFERAAAEASAASGREMSVRSIRRDSEIVAEDSPPTATGTESELGPQYGVLRVSFTWQSFARVGENSTLYVGDAFNTTDGTWLPELSAEQSLTIRPPPGYGGPTTSPIGADEGDLHWSGPTTFEPGYFTIVYSPNSTASPVGGASTVLVVGALALSGSALLLGVYLLFARRRSDGTQGGGLLFPGTSDSAPDSDESVPSSSDVRDADVSTADADDDDADTGASAAATATAEDAHDDEPDFDLLSDEERVEYLLERNGGRMKQATIVKETGWSNAKVSQLLSAMDEADRIDKLRIGRENLISLPGEGLGDLPPDEDDEQ
ncbi:MAG: hypothetical protein RI568_03240 [Natronomonas sp.]|uniref:helix-turn-helix transcriptional regulator n=1 Tax=Natronomonas sp. TaxID=2184060 RepID=UPI0028703547|nr:hypothetical protein [Natronomonas sp.]MDR9429702.1 hypothetical protein [Natronomonas sp.]